MRSLLKGLFAVTLLSLISLGTIAQNPEVNALRKQLEQTADLQEAYCSLCEAFARYTMIDSAEHCLSELKKLDALRPTIQLRIKLIEASLAQKLNRYQSGLSSINDALAYLDEGKFSFNMERRTLSRAIELASYFGNESLGLKTTRLLASRSRAVKDDSALVYALVQQSKFVESANPEDSSRFDLLEQAEALCIEDHSLYGVYFDQVSILHYYFSRLPNTIEYALLAENAFKEQGERDRLIDVYTTFSLAYEEMVAFDRAASYLEKAKPIVFQKQDERWADFMNTLGWLYYRHGNIDKALDAIRKSVRYTNSMSPGNPEIAYPIGNLGLIFQASGQIDSAIYYSQKAVKLFEVLGIKAGIAEALNNLGTIEHDQGNIGTAINYFEKARALAVESEDRYEEMKATGGLYECMKESNPELALRHYQRFSELRVNLLSKEESLKAYQLEAEFFQNRNASRIQQLKYESQLKTLEIDQKNNRILLTTFALVIMIFVTGLTFFYWLQRKRMMQSLEEANKVNQRIISMISHDFRGPLNNVKLTLELLQTGEIDVNEFLVLSKDLYRQSSDLGLMFDSFVGWAMAQRKGYVPAKNEFIWADAIQEATSIVQPLATLKNIEIVCTSKERIEVRTDRMAVSLALRNLLSNAVKYSKYDKKINVKYRLEGTEVVTTISDRGVGMSEEKLHKILTTGDGSEMGTANEYGTGLGLRMVIRYVEGMGGTISAESKEGVGTSFEFRIPISL